MPSTFGAFASTRLKCGQKIRDQEKSGSEVADPVVAFFFLHTLGLVEKALRMGGLEGAGGSAGEGAQRGPDIVGEGQRWT